MSVEVFKRNINAIVKKKGLTRKWIACKCKTSEAELSNIMNLNNSRSVNATTLEKLANALDVTMDELFRGEVKNDR